MVICQDDVVKVKILHRLSQKISIELIELQYLKMLLPTSRFLYILQNSIL